MAAGEAVLELGSIGRPEAQDYSQWQRVEQPAAGLQRGIGQRLVEAEEGTAHWQSDHVHERGGDDDGRDRAVSGQLE